MKKYKYLILSISVLGLIVAFFFFQACTKTEKKADKTEILTELPLLVAYDFEDGKAHGFSPNIPKNWEVAEEEGSFMYCLLAPGTHGSIKAPTSWSLLKDFDVTSFVFKGRARCKIDVKNKNRDVCVIFLYQDPTHFYYVHFSAMSDQVHNIIGLVNGKDRVKINCEISGESIARMNDLRLHDFKVTYDAETGDIKAYMDDMMTPILTATEKTFGHGYVGIGSFDDTASFDDIKLWGKKFHKE